MASKANRLKSEDAEEKEKPKKAKNSKGRLESFKNFIADERTHKITGLVMLLVSFFMCLELLNETQVH